LIFARNRNNDQQQSQFENDKVKLAGKEFILNNWPRSEARAFQKTAIYDWPDRIIVHLQI